MTDQTETRLPQLDHDGDGRAGGAKKVPARTAPTPDDLVWVVTRARGLHRVPATEVDAAVKERGGRTATARDLSIAGVE